jgi:hypothetical protein
MDRQRSSRRTRLRTIRLAEAHDKLSEIPEAIRAFEDYLRLRKESDDDWQSSLLLQLGLESVERRTAAASLETGFSTDTSARREARSVVPPLVRLPVSQG